MPTGFWSVQGNRLRYLRWLQHELGFTQPEDWYQVTQKEFRELCGTHILSQHHRGSPTAVVKQLHPDYDWHEWLFRGLPKGL